MFDVIVVGAGIWGCTIARRLAEAGRKVLVLEKRGRIGGNCACEIDSETGIEIHTYGSHIFHTSNETVWNFVDRFAKFNSYRHCVLANHSGKIYHLPFGRTLYDEFFGKGNYGLPLNSMQNAAIFDAFIKHYTAKQWGMSADKVDPRVIKRLKVRDNYSTDYFDDPYQGIPLEGYNKMFERMLDHENIIVQCNCEFAFDAGKAKVKGEGEQWINSLLSTTSPFVYYSGPIDALFGYKFGALPWRSLQFETEKLTAADYQGNSVVNYPDIDVPYTRIHEFKHYHPESEGHLSPPTSTSSHRLFLTIIMREYPKQWVLGEEPYYPIHNEESAKLLEKYQAAAAKVPGLVIGGRLGQYKYFDMDKSVEAALAVEI